VFVGHVTCYEGKKHRNEFRVRPKPNILGPEGRQYFFHAFWTFG
jgi:hypothetical protein